MLRWNATSHPRRPRAPVLRMLSAGIGTLLLLEAPVALAGSQVRLPTSWGALKQDAGPRVDPALSAAEIRIGLRATARLHPRVTPRSMHRVPLDRGGAIAVSGPAGPGLWATHVVSPDGGVLGSTVFDYAAGVIRDPDGNRVAWRAPTGDLDAELRRIYETSGAEEMLREVMFSVCQMVLTGSLARRCLPTMGTGWQSFLACLGGLLALTAFCYVTTHVSMPPDPDQETGNSQHRPNNPQP